MLFSVLFLLAGQWLVLDEPPRKADVILVFAGDRGQRVNKGVELFKQGHAQYMIMSGGPLYHRLTQAEVMRDHAIELGVPLERIILEKKADSTFENAKYLKTLLQENNFKAAIVVSSNYHMRRVKMLCEREFSDMNIELIYVSAPEPNFYPEQWWSSNKSMMIVLTEYIKLAGYFLGKNS